jgi:hypothetical protein
VSQGHAQSLLNMPTGTNTGIRLSGVANLMNKMLQRHSLGGTKKTLAFPTADARDASADTSPRGRHPSGRESQAMKTVLYCRVSTLDQMLDHQRTQRSRLDLRPIWCWLTTAFRASLLVSVNAVMGAGSAINPFDSSMQHLLPHFPANGLLGGAIFRGGRPLHCSS